MSERFQDHSPGTIVEADEQLRTQVSGKYSPDNPGVFDFKRQLVEAGMDVRFPAGDEIIEYSCGFAITAPHESETPFHTTEVNFLREIRGNQLQITYDMYGENEGYVGESTGIETAYALLCNKPTVLVRPPGEYSPTIARPIKALIEKYKGDMIIEPLDRLDPTTLKRRVGEIAFAKVDFGLLDEERAMVMCEAIELTRKYRDSWAVYKQQAHPLES